MARLLKSRRHRKSAIYIALSCLIVLGSGAALYFKNPGPSAPVIPGERVDGLTDALARAVPAGAPRVRFRDATAGAGVDFHHMAGARSRELPEDMGSGCALADLDGDGDLDLFLVNFEPLDPARKQPGARRGHALYLNDGAGHFEDRSEEAGVATPVHGMGVAVGDYDGDGDLDLFVTAYGPTQLFRNRGDATFEEVAAAAGVAQSGLSSGAAFADYDADGDLDLYVGSYVDYRQEPALAGKAILQYGFSIPFTLNPSAYRPAPNRLYRNRGDGTFEDATAAAGVANPTGRTLAVAFTDLDGDGRPDIYAANDISDNAYFRNRGDGTFEDLSYRTLTADYRGAMGLAVGDFDGDQDADLFITHWLAQENALYECYPGANGAPVTYADVADMNGLGAISLDYVGWGTFFFDVDSDGRPDLLAANGNTLERKDDPLQLQAQRTLLFWNDFPRGFFDVAPIGGEGLMRPGSHRGAAAGDLDGDGDLDVVLTECGGQARILINETAGAGHWIAVSVRDGGGNRFAVGALVSVTAGGGTRAAWVGAQPSYLSAMPLELQFGLGPHAAAERIAVRFPGGSEKVLNDVPADRKITIER